MAVQREGEEEEGQKDVAQQRREASKQRQAPREAICEKSTAKRKWERNLREESFLSPFFSIKDLRGAWLDFQVKQGAKGEDVSEKAESPAGLRRPRGDATTRGDATA